MPPPRGPSPPRACSPDEDQQESSEHPDPDAEHLQVYCVRCCCDLPAPPLGLPAHLHVVATLRLLNNAGFRAGGCTRYGRYSRAWYQYAAQDVRQLAR